MLKGSFRKNHIAIGIWLKERVRQLSHKSSYTIKLDISSFLGTLLERWLGKIKSVKLKTSE
jgi:hypothetical protein